MITTTRRAISYPVQGPNRTDAPDVPLHLQNVAQAADNDAIWMQGTLAARPASTISGTFYWATDNSTLYHYTTSWTAIAALASPAFTGTPTAPTPASTDSSTTLATTAFVRALLPPGVTVPYVGSAAPTGWLLCDGSAVSRATYAALFAVIGTVFGAGDGSTTFNLPDLRGRVPVGKNAATFTTLGGVGGEETHVMTVPEMPSHDHGAVTGATSAGTPAGTINAVSAGTPAGTIDAQSAGTPSGTVHSMFSGSGGAISNSHISTATTGLAAGDANAGDALLTNTFTGSPMGTHAHNFTGSPMGTHSHTFTGTAMGTHTHTVAAQGGGAGHNNLQPYLVMNYIIRT